MVAQSPFPLGFLRCGAGVDGFNVPTAAGSAPLRANIACGDSGSMMSCVSAKLAPEFSGKSI